MEGMNDNVISLASARAIRAGDATEWTVVDCLRQVIADIEAGRMKPDKAVVLLCETQSQGGLLPGFATAGVTRVEAVGMLALFGPMVSTL
jgi:hypothetical protein